MLTDNLQTELGKILERYLQGSVMEALHVTNLRLHDKGSALLKRDKTNQLENTLENKLKDELWKISPKLILEEPHHCETGTTRDSNIKLLQKKEVISKVLPTEAVSKAVSEVISKVLPEATNTQKELLQEELLFELTTHYKKIDGYKCETPLPPSWGKAIHELREKLKQHKTSQPATTTTTSSLVYQPPTHNSPTVGGVNKRMEQRLRMHTVVTGVKRPSSSSSPPASPRRVKCQA